MLKKGTIQVLNSDFMVHHVSYKVLKNEKKVKTHFVL